MLKAKKANIAWAAWENGYFPDKMERPDIDELKGAIRDELFGEKKYAFQQGKESVVKDIEELEAALDMLDIDYTGELETAYNEAVNQYNDENKVTFDEDEYNILTMRIIFHFNAVKVKMLLGKYHKKKILRTQLKITSCHI